MNHDNKNSGYITASGNDLKIGEISASGPTTAQKYFIYYFYFFSTFYWQVLKWRVYYY